ncbi:MAG: photosynthetic complex assembly protein PuhC [Burkholderiales bacterium]|nr:photosynthetic complex assembly protein PuhC [Burkholderiales bacterium]
MSDPFADRSMPRGVLLGAAALIGAALVAVAAVRLTGVGTAVFPPSAQAVSQRDLRFEDRPDGSVAVHEGHGAEPAFVLAPGEDGFIRATLRTFARERRHVGVGAEAPFRLTAWSDGRLTLEDPVTGRRVDLEAFGPTNAGAFARLLVAANGTR